MDKGYTDNGFIVDLTHAVKTSEIIYELSKILDMPETKGQNICLKLGASDLSKSELLSIKTLVELMDSALECISTSSEKTVESAAELEIKVSEFTNEICAPSFDDENQNADVEKALDHIFPENMQAAQDIKPINNKDVVNVIQQSEDIMKDIEAELEKESEDEDVIQKKSESGNLPTLYINRTIRSGQSISSDGNILIIGDVNPGSEVIAKGDITVWGILGGIAHAGSEGNNYAKIRALKLNPVQIRIGDIFARRPKYSVCTKIK